VHFGTVIYFWNIPVVKFDKAVKGKIFFPRGEIDYECCGDIRKGIEFIGLAKVDHIPDESLLVGDLTVELEVIEAEAILSEFVVLKSKGILCPLEEYSFVVARFC
jgi:hypothetical protein